MCIFLMVKMSILEFQFIFCVDLGIFLAAVVPIIPPSYLAHVTVFVCECLFVVVLNVVL